MVEVCSIVVVVVEVCLVAVVGTVAVVDLVEGAGVEVVSVDFVVALVVFADGDSSGG